LAAISAGQTDLDIAFGPLPPPEPDACVYNAVSWLTVLRAGAGYRFVYPDGTEFLIGELGDRVVASTPPGTALEDTCEYLLGPVIGFVLRLRGVVSLHASAVVLGGRAVAFCGDAGAGKSSTAAAFAQFGLPVLAEDVTALDDRGGAFAVQPGYPRVNLWPDSAAALFGSADALPEIVPNLEKRYLALSGSGGSLAAPGLRGRAGPAVAVQAGASLPFHDRPAPLAAIYVLGDRLPQPRPQIRPLKPVDALIALAPNTYAARLLDSAMRSREFAVLSRLASTVPVRSVSPPANIADIRNLCDGLLDDFHELKGWG
jgi:hypothetical protein